MGHAINVLIHDDNTQQQGFVNIARVWVTTIEQTARSSARETWLQFRVDALQ